MNLLSTLRYLVALNEHKHFGRAAQACHITQPALSNAVRALEAEFNVVIVKRDRNFAGLTPEGERVLASAQLMLHEHAILQQELKSDIEVRKTELAVARRELRIAEGYEPRRDTAMSAFDAVVDGEALDET